MKTETMQKLIAHITSECKAIDREARFDDMLDECYSFESIGGPFAHMSPSSVLKECDPTAYRCGVNDWVDGEGWVEIDGEYYDSDEVEKARETFMEELQIEANALERDIEELPSDEGSDELALPIQAELDAIRAEISEVERYSF